MMHGELRRLRDALGWSAAQLAYRLDCGEVTVRAWERGRRKPPLLVLAWLRDVAGLLADHPPPEWRVRKRPEGGDWPRYIPPDIGHKSPTLPAERPDGEGGSPLYPEGGYRPVRSS